VLVALGVVIISSIVLFVFSRAEVTVTPKDAHVSVANTFQGTLSNVVSADGLSYQILSVEQTKSDSVSAEGTETVNNPAQGTITVYNEQTTSQALIKNTRFESKDGHIFLAQESVKIPGGKPGAPGMAVAKVYAKMPGPDYNIGATTFTVPGLKGGKSYSLVYAKSDKAMTGGFVGTRGTISKGVADAKRIALDSVLDTELATALDAKMPEGYVRLPGSSVTTHEPIIDTKSTDSTSVAIQEKGTMRAVVFSEEALARAIAYKTVGQYQGEALSLPDTKDLMLSFASGAEPWTPEETTSTFTIKGEVTLLWKVIPNKIAGAVAGKTPDAARVVLTSGGFTEVGGAKIILRPFWRSTFPEDPSSITVSVEKP
jgi:hypothetical protein